MRTSTTVHAMAGRVEGAPASGHSWLVVLLVWGSLVSRASAAPAPFEIGDRERLLVVAPHPDDETLGAGALIQRVVARGGTVRIVLVTAGDGYVEGVVHETGRPRPRPSSYIAYGERRVAEARTALRVLAGHQARLQLLGFPDGELARLLRAHWEHRHPERSPFTDALHPPYPEAVDPGLAYDGADLRRELQALLRDMQPTLVAFPDPFDRHPDHRATGLFTLLAVADRTRETVPVPRLLAYLVHWPGWPPGWDANPPLPTSAAETELTLPPTLPERGLARTALVLTAAELTTKRAALARYVTQQEEMATFLAAFVRRTEPFSVLTATDLRHVSDMVERPPAAAPGR